MKINKFAKLLVSVILCLSMLLCGALVSCNNEPEAADGGDMVNVVRAKTGINLGTKIPEDSLEIVAMDASVVPAGALSRKEDVVGKFATAQIFAGDFFSAEKLSSKMPVVKDEGKEEDDQLNFDDAGYVLVSDYLKPDPKKDAADAIQKLIDENPNRTLYFPDGTYLLSKPIETSADPDKKVSFKLSNYAQFKPMDTWTYGEPLFKIGARDEAREEPDAENGVVLEGGILNGDNRADAIWVVGGGNVSIRYSAIKYAVVGIHVKADENGGGPTVDVTTTNIVGSGTLDSVGVILETDNNTLTNMRIAANQICIKLLGNGNFLRNLHPLYVFRSGLKAEENYVNSIAFYDGGTRNFYDNCYNDQFSTGFYLVEGNRSIFDCCFNYWYTEGYGYHNAFVCEGKFDAVIRMADAEFGINTDGIECNFLLVGEDGGSGMIDAVAYKANKVSERDVAKDYLINDPIIN
jgi:hypothetical protein